MSRYLEVLSKYNTKFEDSLIAEKISNILDTAKNAVASQEILSTIYSCIDLTSLNAYDSKESIWKLVDKINKQEDNNPALSQVASICVFPNFVATVREALTSDAKIASVAGGFPSGQTFTEIKLAETSLAILDGADEIDLVVNVGALLEEDYEHYCTEIEEVKHACKDVALKVILETGLLKSPELIANASLMAAYSGADFIKTSTGKEHQGATLEAVLVICEVLKAYHASTGIKIGLKVSGGVRTIEDALKYYFIVKTVLGDEWLNPSLFRIGASKLADTIYEQF
ncbi:2-deoxyribose-5-phosphate aldolase [Bacteroidales bacterium]|nr:2-deoxyribose-5-phosphate aldolase [Bacteroidales bacterium]